MNINFTLIGQIGTFLVLWWFVQKYIWPLFAEAVEKRRQIIAEGLSKADEAKFAMINAQNQSAETIEQAKAQANEILIRTQKQADEIIHQAKEEAQKVSQRQLESALAEIEQAKFKAREELKQQLALLVVQGATQIIGREVNAQDHQRLLQELNEKL